ncbi:MAG: Catabolite repression HPr-like protein Crh [Candidatus Kapaibacterium sp.]|jgi:phosphocarrier protein|nr:MAG: Catabolite repression HPr-like protein Crh [Candidatus Kapabacteria bacterium]ROL57903.1 MAG: HPr family phosphocarrier protein [Bacteroidetes/Chlorobi group bacterium Naka2016]
MISEIVEVINPAGMHTRPAAEIVKVASRFKSKILLEVDGYTVNAKSIIGLMTLPAPQGTKVKIVAEGEDEENAVKELRELFKRGFDEI